MNNYNTIDIFICAILIVFMHTYCNDLGNAGTLFVKTICTIAVPFFFIASGFLLAKGFERHSNTNVKNEYFLKYIKRIINMYVVWSAITLPIAFLIIQQSYNEQTIIFKIAYIFRLFFLVGSIGVYWYILSLIYDSTIIFYYQRKSYRLLYLFIFATILWICGVIYDSPFNNGNLFFESIHVVFGSERNFLNVGLFYIMIGLYFQKYEHKLKINTTFLTCMFFVTILLRLLEIIYIKTNTMQALLAIILFAIAINCNIKTNYAKKMRELSICIYLIHFPFILLFDFYLRKGTFEDFLSNILFCFIAFYIINKYFPEKLKKTLLR